MVDYIECLFYDASPEIHKRAKELRKTMTESEMVFWEIVRNRRIKGFKFRRQHPISNFIADFYCHELKLIVEIDGEIHNKVDNKEYDKGRTAELGYLGISVVRFTNDEIHHSPELVVRKLKEKIVNITSP